MAKTTRTTTKSRERMPVVAAAPPGLRWPLWAAGVLSFLYLLSHAAMIPVASALWGGLLSALVLGR